MARYWVALFPVLALAGCTTATAPVSVTRFYGQNVPHSRTVLMVPGPDVVESSIEYRTYANAVADAMRSAGFTLVDSGQPSDLKVVVDYGTSVDRPIDTRRSPVSVSVGGSTGSYGSGLGIGVGLDLSGPPKAAIGTSLFVQLRDAQTDKAVWEGRAQTVAREGTAGAQPGIAAGKLARALFRDYPGASGQTITVK